MLLVDYDICHRRNRFSLCYQWIMIFVIGETDSPCVISGLWYLSYEKQIIPVLSVDYDICHRRNRFSVLSVDYDICHEKQILPVLSVDYDRRKRFSLCYQWIMIFVIGETILPVLTVDYDICHRRNRFSLCYQWIMIGETDSPCATSGLW